MNTPVIEMRGVCRYYQSSDVVVKALDGVDLTIWPGEMVAIMGQSGSGKSTLMNVLGCLDRATAGTYHIYGQDISSLNNDQLAELRREHFGFIFQRYNLLATDSAEENVEVPALYAGIPADQRQNRARELLAQLGLKGREEHRPSQLSGGQQQRVAIARALMNNPLVILADEPTGALDSKTSVEVMALLKELNTEGRTIILITHDEEVAAHANRIIHIRDGKIISDDNRKHLSSQPQAQKPLLVHTASHLKASTVEAVKMAIRNLRVNLFRTALTLLGIIIGVAAMIIMLAVGNGSKQKVLDQISSLGTNIMQVRPGAPGIRSSGDIATLIPADAKAIENQIDNIIVVVPERSGVKTIRYGNVDYSSQVQGVGAGFSLARDWKVINGTFFTQQDVDGYAATAVLGTTVADIFFKDTDPVGKFLLVGNIPFEIIGVMESKGAAPWGGDQDNTIFVPYTTAMVRLLGSNYLNSITIKVEDVTRIAETEMAITELIKARHNAEDFSVRNTASFIEMATETQNTLTILLGAVAAISLLVGGIGVMNIMLVSVVERTREIGIRMATGARTFDIMTQFITEAAVVCTIGGLLGALIGFGAGLMLSFFDVQIMFTLAPPLLAFSSAIITGIVFGYLPARKASRLDPVIALGAE